MKQNVLNMMRFVDKMDKNIKKIVMETLDEADFNIFSKHNFLSLNR